MKKIWIASLALILALSVALPAFALGMTFTHPEIGEPMTVSFVNGMPQFKIYGFTYYQIVDPQTPYRGLTANRTPLIGEGMPGLEESVNQMLDSAEAASGREGLSFSAAGVAADYAEQLDRLPRGEFFCSTVFQGRKGTPSCRASLDLKGRTFPGLPIRT